MIRKGNKMKRTIIKDKCKTCNRLLSHRALDNNRIFKDYVIINKFSKEIYLCLMCFISNQSKTLKPIRA